MIRKASVLGQFYPASISELNALIRSWGKVELKQQSQVAIVPHAGYVYSGETAWKALSQLSFDTFDRIVIIGPSHRVRFSGISCCEFDTFETPAGTHPMDNLWQRQFYSLNNIGVIPEVHCEHSTEVQVPLIDVLAQSVPIIECVYGFDSALELQTVITQALSDKTTGVVVSSDLSHYHSEERAHRIDRNILEAIEQGDVTKLQQGEACGMDGILALLTVLKQENRSLSIVDYCTSADCRYGDSERVVGYLSAIEKRI